MKMAAPGVAPCAALKYKSEKEAFTSKSPQHKALLLFHKKVIVAKKESGVEVLSHFLSFSLKNIGRL